MVRRIILFSILLLAFGFSVSFALTKKISGTTNIDDAGIESYLNADQNYGVRTQIDITTDYYGYAMSILIRVKNVASELGLGATNITAICSLYCMYHRPYNSNISVYRVFKPWVEGTFDDVTCTGVDNGATWNDWNCLAYEWGTGGCTNASDAGTDNSGDGTDYDRKATAESNVNITTANTWYAWNISTELATGWYNGTITENGIILVESLSGGYNGFFSTEYTTDPTKRPFFVFTYIVAEADTALLRIKDDWRFLPSFIMDWRFQDSVSVAVAQVQKIFNVGTIDTIYTNGVVQNIYK